MDRDENFMRWKSILYSAMFYKTLGFPYKFTVYLYVTLSRGMSHMSMIFNFEIFIPPGILQMLHFYTNPVRIGCLVTE